MALKDKKAKQGVIIKQSVEAGEKLNARDTITLTCGEYSDTISVLVMDEEYYTDVILAQNYDPNGTNFSWTILISPDLR